MSNTTYETRRGELKTYFDKTAKDKWVALTSNTPVSRIRETVRAGREEMRNTLLAMLPQDLSGARILDAGCGTGMLTMEAAKRGADVLATDISPALVEEAELRFQQVSLKGNVEFKAGDMSDPSLGEFDYIVAMDSLIHYPLPAIMSLLEGFAPRTSQSINFTFAPRTNALVIMKAIGKLFPKNDRSPAIEPVSEKDLSTAISQSVIAQSGFKVQQTKLVSTGFYKSQAMELSR